MYVCLNFDKGCIEMSNNSNLTFKDLERKYYLEGNTLLANLYAQLDDFERECESLEDELWEVQNNG